MQYQDPLREPPIEAQVCKIMALINAGMDSVGGRRTETLPIKTARVPRQSKKPNSGFAEARAERRARLVDHIQRYPDANPKLLSALYGYTVDSVRLIKHSMGIATPHPQDRGLRARYKALAGEQPGISDQAAAGLLGCQRSVVSQYRRDLASGTAARCRVGKTG